MKEIYLVKLVRHHPRLYVSILIGLLVGVAGSLFGIDSKITQAIIGYNSGALVYIFWAMRLMFFSTAQQMHKRALIQDDGKLVVLFLVVLALIFSMGAIFVDLASIKNLYGAEKIESIFLALITLVSSWFFTNTVFALHYAHDYFFDLQMGLPGGLVFLPENEEPEYLDFLYFAFILGATAQTADVTLSSKKMRRTCTLHSILAFFFNTSLLALAVNMSSGLV